MPHSDPVEDRSPYACVTAETLLGAICVYILIGLFFAYVDLAYQFIADTSYFAQPGQHGPSDFVYFSYITMTTVGYGDLSPATGFPRTTSVLEALMGQIFLVVLVSRLVAMYTPGSAASRPGQAAGPVRRERFGRGRRPIRCGRTGRRPRRVGEESGRFHPVIS